MLTRRMLLASGTGLLLAGCTPGTSVRWLPWASPEPVPIVVPDGLPGTVARLAGQARRFAADGPSLGLTAIQRGTLDWLADTLDLHSATLAGADPARRQPGSAPPVPSPRPVTDAAAGRVGLRNDLDDLARRYRELALTDTGPAALLWASLAGCSSASAAVLATGTSALGGDQATKTPALADDPQRYARLLQRSRELAYGLETALAAPRLVKADRTALRGRLAAWRSLRDLLTERLRTAGTELPADPVGYLVDPPGDRRRAYRLAARLEEAMLPQLGAWVANADAADRAVAVPRLIAGARVVARFSGPLLRWPGWPG